MMVLPINVAVVAPLVAPVVHGSAQIGGAQAVLADLCRGLVAAGHRVWLIASEGSRVPGAVTVDLGIDAAVFAPARFVNQVDRQDVIEQTKAFELIYTWLNDHAANVDIVHAHAYDAPAFDVLTRLRSPLVHTLHLPPISQPVVQAVRSAGATAVLVTVSPHNARLWLEHGVQVSQVVPNGVDVESMPFGEDSERYLLFAGRISPEKGPHVALEAALKTGLPLLLAGGLYDEDYYQSRVAPYVRFEPDWRLGDAVLGDAIYIGSRPRAEIWQLMSRAAAVLMPASWDEPFGLVAIEAQAAGCPVVAFARGGLTDVIDDGVTGYLIQPEDQRAMADAIPRAAGLSRIACRDWVRQRYSLPAMVRAYEQLYERLAG